MEWKNALTLVDASEITFQNLIANTTYKILARIKADPENSAFASETASREVKTKGTKTEGPSVSDLFTNCDLTAAGINVKKTAGCEYLLIPAEDSENMETYKKATGWTKVESAGGNEILTLTQYCDNSGQMHSVVSGTKYKVLVRYYETEDTMASEPTTSSEARTVLLPAPNEDKGSESINFADEKFTIPNGYEISRNKDFAEGTIVTDGSAITPNTTYYIRKKANGLIPASAATAFRTPDRLEKDETLAIDYETEKITIPAGYSYSINGAAAIAVTETAAEITVSPETKIAWWKNAADGKFASEKSERTAPPRGAITKPEIKYAEETVATTALMQYSTDNGKTWNDCTANMTFAALGYGDGSKDITIQFRTAATETNYASDSVSVTIPKRADEPTGGESGSGGYQIDYKNESITVPSGYEYRETGATTWTKGPVNNISMKPGTSYEIRKSATGSAPAGAVTTVTMPTRPAAPTKDNGYSIDYSKETITPGEGYEVRKVTKPESEWSDSAEFTPGAQYEIRKKATDGKNGTTAAPAGEPATVSIPARPAAPTTGEGGLKVTNETAKGQGNGKVSGITDKMEYRIGDSGDWLPGTGADVALGVGETIQVRVKATADAPHGEEITFKGEAGPALTVTFDRQDGSKVDAKLEDIEYNKPITAPIQPTRNGYVFLGWYIDAAGTQPWNFNLEGVKTNMTLYAKWVNVTYTVGGSVMEGEGKDAKPVQNAKVTIKQGSKEVAPETSTDAEGKYSFADIPAGVYNIIVTSKDAQKNEKTMTEMVEVTADTKVKTIIMPSANVSSKLEIKGSSGIIVGGLNKEAVDNADKTGNAHVSITATIKETDESDQTEQNSIDKIKKKADKEKQADNLAYIIITVEKKVGEKDATTVAETTTLLEFRIPFITSGRKDFKVYRSHKAEGSETIDTLTTTAKDGEYIEVGNGYLIIHAKKFSTYAVGYTEDTTTPSSGGSASGGGYIPPTTGSGVTTTGSGAAKVTTAIADVKNETTTGASGKQETIAKITVSAANQRETISQAKANKSKQIVIKVSEKDIQSGAKLELSLDKSFIDSIVKDTEASLKIEMPNSAKTFTRNELAQLAASADGNTVTVDLAETGEQPTDPADKNAKIIKGVQNTDITLKSAKGKKRGILLTWTKEKGYKVDYYEIYRSTKKNSGYGKKPFFRTKDGNVTKYLNTKNVKAGKTYYYRIRGVRVVDGKKYYTEYSNKAYRATK